MVYISDVGGREQLFVRSLDGREVRQLTTEMEDLDGDRPVVPQVVGEIDRRHTAAPQLAVQHVPVAQMRRPGPRGWSRVCRMRVRLKCALGRVGTPAAPDHTGYCHWNQLTRARLRP
jgi:hypothetical protein